MSELTNFQRESRTESRIAEIVSVVKKNRGMYRTALLAELSAKWGVSEDTVATHIQASMRSGRVAYVEGKYKA